VWWHELGNEIISEVLQFQALFQPGVHAQEVLRAQAARCGEMLRLGAVQSFALVQLRKWRATPVKNLVGP
jgi:hypothetical protein